MKNKNTLSEHMLNKFGSKKIIPVDLLKKSNITPNRFWKIRTNRTEMYGWELIILADWIAVEPKELYKKPMKKEKI